MPKRRSALSLAVRHESGSGRPGRATPLWSETTPPAVTRHRASRAWTCSTASWIVPSSIQIWSPGRSGAKGAGGRGGGARGRPLHGVGGEHKGLARHEHGAAAHEVAEPHLGSLQVLDDGDGMTPLALAFPDGANHRRVLFVRAVREVEPSHVHARLDELAQGGHVATGRTDGGDDPGAPHASTLARICPV